MMGKNPEDSIINNINFLLNFGYKKRRLNISPTAFLSYFSSDT
tara:strand:+ start:89 stop:217 length:129 start_codon:yes stop_codon:yes gene_type:complete